MVRRKGLGSGKGQGYKNVLGKDSSVHSQSAKGIKQPIPINESKLNAMDKNKINENLKTPSKKEIKEYMDLHNQDEVGEFDKWDMDEAEYQLLLSDKYYYTNIKDNGKQLKNKIKKPLSQRQISNRNYEKYIIDSIDGESYGKNLKTTQEKLQFLKDTFKSEYSFMIKRVGEQNAFKEWLGGLPSAISLPFYNVDILKLAKKMGSLPKDATEKQEDRVLENYWNFMATKTFQAFKKYKIE